MQEQDFWNIVDSVRQTASNDLDARVDLLAAHLENLEGKTIVAFQAKYDEMIDRADRWDLWGAAYLINGGCSDDGFRYFRDWLISEGSSVYAQSLANPDQLADFDLPDDCELESFGYVALDVYEEKFKTQLARHYRSPHLETQGEPWEEDDLAALLPRLAAKYC